MFVHFFSCALKLKLHQIRIFKSGYPALLKLLCSRPTSAAAAAVPVCGPGCPDLVWPQGSRWGWAVLGCVTLAKLELISRAVCWWNRRGVPGAAAEQVTLPRSMCCSAFPSHVTAWEPCLFHVKYVNHHPVTMQKTWAEWILKVPNVLNSASLFLRLFLSWSKWIIGFNRVRQR